MKHISWTDQVMGDMSEKAESGQEINHLNHRVLVETTRDCDIMRGWMWVRADDLREKKGTGGESSKHKCQDIREIMVLLNLQKCVCCVCCAQVRAGRNETRQVSRTQVRICMLVCLIVTWRLKWRACCQLCFRHWTKVLRSLSSLIVPLHHLYNALSFNVYIHTWLEMCFEM